MTYKMHLGVQIGKDAQIGDFVIIGQPPSGREPGELPTVLGARALIRSHTVIYAGNVIGEDFVTGHGVMIREENEIDDYVSIGSKCVIEHHVIIGHSVRIHSQAFIPEYSVIEEGCWIGPNVVFTNALHPLCPKAKACLKGPTVKKGAKIGANATILPDITIGENALVGAGAVVTGNVPPETVVTGNPATVIKKISELCCPFGLIDKPY